MKMYSMFFFVICLNISAFIIAQSSMSSAGQELVWSPEQMAAVFNWQSFAVSLGIAGSVTGLLMVLTKQFMYASLALILWAISMLWKPLEWFVAGVPLMLNVLLPTELWYISAVIEGVFAMIFFFFIIEVATQRRIT